MRAALQTTSDVEMLEVLQIGHQEMPDAIKTLQRALEHVTERDNDGVEASPSKSVAVIVLKEGEGLSEAVRNHAQYRYIKHHVKRIQLREKER